MKSKRMLAVFIAALLCSSFFLTSCRKKEGSLPPVNESETEEPETPPQEEPETPPQGQDDGKYKNLSVSYLDDLMIDTSHIMAYSIKKEKKSVKV